MPWGFALICIQFTTREKLTPHINLTFQGDQGSPGQPGPEEVIKFPPDFLPPKGQRVETTVVNLWTQISLKTSQFVALSLWLNFSPCLSLLLRETQACRDHVDQRAYQWVLLKLRSLLFSDPSHLRHQKLALKSEFQVGNSEKRKQPWVLSSNFLFPWFWLCCY